VKPGFVASLARRRGAGAQRCGFHVKRQLLTFFYLGSRLPLSGNKRTPPPAPFRPGPFHLPPEGGHDAVKEGEGTSILPLSALLISALREGGEILLPCEGKEKGDACGRRKDLGLGEDQAGDFVFPEASHRVSQPRRGRGEEGGGVSSPWPVAKKSALSCRGGPKLNELVLTTIIGGETMGPLPRKTPLHLYCEGPHRGTTNREEGQQLALPSQL